jgi:septal ring factor EnvC (AmiA/AmiB activator)
VAVAAVAILATSAAAQEMTTGDVQRLQQTADQIGDELVNVRSHDRAAARAMQAELTELEEEITYLKVRLRRERSVPRAHYVDVRDRLEDLRSRVIGGEGSSGRYSSTMAAVQRRRRPARSLPAPRSTFGCRRR